MVIFDQIFLLLFELNPQIVPFLFILDPVDGVLGRGHGSGQGDQRFGKGFDLVYYQFCLIGNVLVYIIVFNITAGDQVGHSCQSGNNEQIESDEHKRNVARE